MKYYTVDDKEKNILIYEYKALKDKLYEYKKSKMEELENKFLKASFTIPNGYDYNFKDNEINYIRYDRINRMYPPYIKYSKELSSSKEEQEKLLESFYSGTIKIGEFIDSRSYLTINSMLLFPYELGVQKDLHDRDLYFTNDIIVIPNSLKLLHEIENENINYISDNIDLLDQQLDCFKFTSKPVESVSIDNLQFLLSNSECQNDIIAQAKDNKKVLKYIIK